jgi:hypothetical protein
MQEGAIRTQGSSEGKGRGGQVKGKGRPEGEKGKVKGLQTPKFGTLSTPLTNRILLVDLWLVCMTCRPALVTVANLAADFCSSTGRMLVVEASAEAVAVIDDCGDE